MLLNAPSLDVAKFASTKESRPVLSGLSVMKDRCVATDSYSMLEVMHMDQASEGTPAGIPNDAKTGIFPAKAALDACKNIPKGDTLFTLKRVFSSVGEDKRMIMTTTDLMKEKTVEAPLIEGVFPPYETVIPKGKPVAQIKLDAKFLRNMAEYFENHADSRHVLIQFYGEDKPLVFKGHTAVTIQQVRGIVMPCKIDLMDEDDDEPVGITITKKDADEMVDALQTAIPGADEISVEVNGKTITKKKKKK